MRVEIIGPRIEDRPLIKNLYVFYRYDLMAFIERGPGSFINEFGTIDGQTSRAHDEAVSGEDIYWQKPGILTPLLIRADGRPASFAILATPPHADSSVNYRMNDFFVLNKCRRHGVATRAAAAILDRFRGKWEIGFLPSNTPAASRRSSWG